MTKEKKILSLRISAVILLMLLAASVVVFSGIASNVSLKDDIALQSEYVIGSEVKIPAGTLVVDGEEHAADAVVYTPDGKAIKTEKLVLDAVGKYSVKYTARVNGKIYSETVEFFAKKPAMSIDGFSSKYTYDSETDRIHLDMAANEVFTFNHPIDLTGRDARDELISIYVDSKGDTRDFEEYIIVLTDAFDPDNKVYVRVQADWGPIMNQGVYENPEHIYYYSVWQAYTAVNFDGGKYWTFMSGGNIRTGEQHGKPVWTSFCNRGHENVWLSKDNPPLAVEDDVFALGYDDETKQLHSLGVTVDSGNTLIADLDDPAFFPEGNFKGFTNGMVYISVYAQDVHSSARFVIKNIDSDMPKDGLISDTEAPIITPNTGEYSLAEIPNAIVGKPYSIFGASVADRNITNKTVDCKVYYNYNTAFESRVDINDGTFIPARSGAYTIVYKAVDNFGNIGEACVEVSAIDNAKPLAITAESGTAVAGFETAIPTPQLVSSDTLTGNLYLTVKAKRNNTEDILYEGKFSEYTARSYTYMMSGEWTIEYTVSDYVRRSVAEAKINVTAQTSIIYESFDSLAVDKYFITGSTYLLPAVKVVSFTDTETVYTDAKIKIVYEGGEKLLDSRYLAVDSTMGSRVTVIYYDESNTEISISGERSVYNIGTVGGYDLSKLYLSDGAAISATANNVTIASTANTTVDFINKISSSEIDLRFILNSAEKNFGKFNIIITDAENPDIQVKINIENMFNIVNMASGNSKIYVNGNSSAGVIMSSASFTGLNQDYFRISYSNVTKTVKHNNQSIIITNCVNGDVFEGFTGGCVYVAFEMENVSGDASIEMIAINGQSMSNYKEDSGKPVVNINGSYASTYGIGTTLTTLTGYGIDVISGLLNAEITIKRVDSGLVKDVNGVSVNKLDASKAYEIVLDAYGEYIITYTTRDASGIDGTRNVFSFYVEDVTKPTVELSGDPVKVVKRGDSFIMPNISASDDSADTIPTFAIIVDSNDKYVCVGADGYTFVKKGTHKVILGAFDAEGNMTSIQYYVEVI